MTDTALVPATQPATMSPYAAAKTADFELAQRQAKALAASTMVPSEYRGNLPNVMVAIELADRIGCSVFAVMQNVDIIHGRPSMRAKFLIATVNACGRFTPLRFRWEGERGTPEHGCRAYATDRESGEECVGALISWGLVKAEGWDKKKGSKWITMPEQMFMYRAAAFWQRIFAPELSLGMQTREESDDMHVVQVEPERGSSSLAAKLVQADEPDEVTVEVSAGEEPDAVPEDDQPSEPETEPIDIDHDQVTGEVYGAYGSDEM